MTKILILGGTKEAAELAAELTKDGHDVETSLAGRTKEPQPVAGKTRIGGFGGAQGLAEYLKTGQFERMIDATHPFAKQISINAKEASRLAGIPLEVKTRPPWQRQKNHHWIEVSSLESARDAIPSKSSVLLALGSQHIHLFKTRDDVHFLVRMVDNPSTPLPLPDYELLIGKPSADWNEEAAMLRQHAISHIVCRNSGGEGAYAKIEAARNLGIPVIIVAR
ncbi:MAG: cobalt-precorrin-6A reductase [Pseudomonadota bacterium]